mmetsp:Transcript_21752/g.20878  ORF Transcript_21752/g.20878 Transcript_21752/m.20878 type:complete len:94 (+) Transcript_21752:1687-1968(+)
MFKQLIKQIDDTYKNTTLTLEDIYWRGWNEQGPWFLVAEMIKKDLEETGTMKDKIELMTDKLKDSSMQFLKLKKEKEEIMVINSSLEQRIRDV